MTDVNRVVHAAGGVVWRPDGRILMVHRPRYDDWTLPKGKLDAGEHRLTAAVREVYEESGVQGAVQVRLPSVRYLTGEPGVDKQVHYWSMRCVEDHGHEPTDEVDALRWVRVPDAKESLTYSHDRGVVAAFDALPPVASLVVLVRHATAGKRGTWPGPDDERPLDADGTADARRAAEVLLAYRPEQVLSAPALRCRDTVAPLADLVGATLRVDPRFAEDADVAVAAAAVREIAAQSPMTVVGSQGGLMKPLLALLRGGVEPEVPKGTAWALSFTSTGRLIAADALDPRVSAT